MAELAAGAVSSLLGVIRNEALLLGRVRHDVQFIQEEMESMRSFLAHLAKKASGGGEHDEQMRTWMNQVRLLAQDCNNCIDLYLYRGNPEIHLARGGLRRYISWLPWFVDKMIAQHHAAIQLRALKARARDIGERRLRYGVEVPAKGVEAGLMAGEASSLVYGAAMSVGSGDEGDDSDNQLVVAIAANEKSGPGGSRAFLESRTPEDNIRLKLAEWIKDVAQAQRSNAKKKSIPSVAVVAANMEETRAIADEASAMWKKHCTRSVLVDIPAVHFYFLMLDSQNILYYILRELRSTESQPQKPDGQGEGEDDRMYIFREKLELGEEIMKKIQGMKVDGKFSEIKHKIEEMKGGQLQLDLDQMNKHQLDQLESTKEEPLGVLLRALWLLRPKPAEGASATKQGKTKKEPTCSHEDIIKETAKKLKEHMERETIANPLPKEHMEKETDANLKPKEHMEEKTGANPLPKEHMEEEAGARPILLKEAHYELILREVFPMTSRKTLQTHEQYSKQDTTATCTTILGEEQIKAMIRKELHEQFVKKLDSTDGKTDQHRISYSLIEETKKNIEKIQWKMNEQLVTKGVMDKINDCLEGQRDKILVIIKLDDDYVSEWEETKNVFSMLGWIAGALLLTTTVNSGRAKEYCYPPREPICFSLHGLYRDFVLELRKQQMNEDNPQIYLDILEMCKEHEFCMKIFVHALYANPKRSNEELSKLHRTLQEVSNNTSNSIGIAKKMFKFAYSDLPKEYKSCLLYLDIFPQQQSIRRSTLIGRWIVEGLITKEDWVSSVRHANRCFDALVDRWLVYPADIGAIGQVKSCMIGDLVHGFITKIARKQRIVETRLSHHLARHFSIFNDLRLRGSDRIDKFFQKIYEESCRVSLIKVLDLEGCQCFGRKNQRYLKDICMKMLLLKYLSLRGTNVTYLPGEINNLRELEVLDIRQTLVPPSATEYVLLLKLKRLLAGHIVPGPGSSELSSVKVPDKIEKMTNVEVLSNVKPRSSQDLKDIGKLWQLRKLGVVIELKERRLRNLLRAISDLHECLKSLSITLLPTENEESTSTSREDFTKYILEHHLYSPKLLESLSISGTTKMGQLLPLLAKDINQRQLVKVTLSRTWLKEAHLKVLAKLPKLLCLRLREKAYIDIELTFNKEEFQNLKCFLLEGSNMTNIIFEGGAAPKLEKVVLSSIEGLQSLSGVEGLSELKEVEFKNNNKLLLFDKAKNISKVTLYGIYLGQGELNILATMPNMRCLVLKETSFVQDQLIFDKDEFAQLNLLIMYFCGISKISFTGGSAPKLEKIIWSFTKGTVVTLSGIGNLRKLKELEINGDFVPNNEVSKAIIEHRVKFVHNKLENQAEAMGRSIAEKEDAARFPFCWKRQV